MTRRLISGLVLAGILMSACGGDPKVVLGEGKLPDSVPDGFPIPAAGVIGSTMVDSVNSRTEVEISVPGAMETVVRFYTLNLVEAGYVVGASTGDQTSWSIGFSRNSLQGTIQVTALGAGASRVVVTLNRATG